MSETPQRDAGMIGPNAVLQMLPQIKKIGGDQLVTRMLWSAGITHVPDGTQMIPEGQAARLHRLLRKEEPELAPALAAAAGRNTARYILVHRIPKPVQVILRVLPAHAAAHLLSRAIAKHAWTFVGSGKFERLNAWTFQITNNPVIRGETSDKPLCTWHAAVFEKLYRALVHKSCRCVETSCCALRKNSACEFRISMCR
ncbi:MAG: bacteriochlorophyll 4-vinyl reductase [Pseudomonadota bacterium]